LAILRYTINEIVYRRTEGRITLIQAMMVTGSDLSKKTFGDSGESNSDEVGGDIAGEDDPATGIMACGGVVKLPSRMGLDSEDDPAIRVVKAGNRLRFTEEMGVTGVSESVSQAEVVSGLFLPRGVGERASRSEKRAGNGSVLRM
jgi:hypothetical protein